MGNVGIEGGNIYENDYVDGQSTYVVMKDVKCPSSDEMHDEDDVTYENTSSI